MCGIAKLGFDTFFPWVCYSIAASENKMYVTSLTIVARLGALHCDNDLDHNLPA
jgi:hypothetical protein